MQISLITGSGDRVNTRLINTANSVYRQHFFRRSIGDDSPVLDENNAVGERARKIQVMQHENYSHPPRRRLARRCHKRRLMPQIEMRGRLIENEDGCRLR